MYSNIFNHSTTAPLLRGDKCFDCSQRYSLTSKQWKIKETPGLLEYFQHKKNLEFPGSGFFIDPAESICQLCYGKVKKAYQRGQIPKADVQKINQKIATNYMVSQMPLYSTPTQSCANTANDTAPIYSHRPDVSQALPCAQSQVPLQRDPYCQKIMKYMIPPDSIVSVGNIGYASTLAVQRYLSPRDLTHVGGSSYRIDDLTQASSRAVKYSSTAHPTFRFRNVLPPSQYSQSQVLRPSQPPTGDNGMSSNFSFQR